VSDHPFGSAADQDIGNAALAVGAHDDEITILFLGKRVDGGLRQVGRIKDFFDLDVRKRHFAYFFNTDKKRTTIYHQTRRKLKVRLFLFPLRSPALRTVGSTSRKPGRRPGPMGRRLRLCGELLTLSTEIQIGQPQGNPGK
jgi:hypothetical protein